MAYDSCKISARAPAEPVPDREPAYEKSRALIALQLIKRWRNVLFGRRDRANLRRPPSVLLSKLIADNANRTRTLSEEIEHQGRCLLARLEAEKAQRRLIREVNPRCAEDILTDRWPSSFADQDLMISDLRDFVAKMQSLRTGNLSLADTSKILEGLFGERPARKVIDEYVARSPAGGNRIVPVTDGFSAPPPGSRLLRSPERRLRTASSETDLLPLSVVEQDRRLRRDFPDFRLLFDGVFVGAWEGTVTPYRPRLSDRHLIPPSTLLL